MAILKNKTQANFTQISNTILADKTMSMRERGVLCTLCSLADGWQFSVEGLATLCLDGKDSIRKSIDQLEELGYLTRTKTRDAHGKFYTIIEIFTTKQPKQTSPSRPCRHGETSTVKPSPDHRDESTVTEKTTQYNNTKTNTDTNNLCINPINQSYTATDGKSIDYKALIANNIDLDSLLEIAKKEGENKVGIVHNIYDILCEVVAYPREPITIRNVEYPWDLVKSRFLKIRKENVLSIINRLTHGYSAKTDKYGYLVSTLFTESQTGALPGDNEIQLFKPDHQKSSVNNSHENRDPNKNFKYPYMQRTYTDDEINAFEKKKLGIVKS